MRQWRRGGSRRQAGSTAGRLQCGDSTIRQAVAAMLRRYGGGVFACRPHAQPSAPSFCQNAYRPFISTAARRRVPMPSHAAMPKIRCCHARHALQDTVIAATAVTPSRHLPHVDTYESWHAAGRYGSWSRRRWRQARKKAVMHHACSSRL